MKPEKQTEFKPYIPADKVIPEFTVLSAVIGAFVALIFGAANAYLALKIGMTISASIPAAVISMGIIRGVLHKNSILENNIVQTIGSIGVSIATGIAFVMPALYMCSNDWGTSPPGIIYMFFISLIGGMLGMIFMVPLRKALIVKEHETLPYPEGTACAEVLMAGEKGGADSKPVFVGIGVAAGLKFVSDGIGLYPSSISLEANKFGLPNGEIGASILPALIGVGYICGFKISAFLFSGSVLGWLVLMPLIGFFGGDQVIYPGSAPINQMSPTDLWSNYIRYIGAGAVAVGGLISLIKALPIISQTFKKLFKNFGQKSESIRTDRDISSLTITIIFACMFLLMILVPDMNLGILGAVLVILFGFLFSTVSSRAVGLVGSSNSPTSGMVIASVLLISIIFKQLGFVGKEAIISIITVAAIVCEIISVSGDTSQDLKTGFLVGATPKKQQLSEIIGIVVSALSVGFIMFLFYRAWGFGNINLPAPQASLIKIIVEGVMSGNLPWALVFIGGFIAIMAEIIGIPVLPFAVGLYLPFEVNATVFVGGVVRLIFDKLNSKKLDSTKGTLYCSGLIAGEGIVGVLLAGFAIIPFNGGTLADAVNISEKFNFGVVGSIVGLLLIILSIFWFSKANKANTNEKT